MSRNPSNPSPQASQSFQQSSQGVAEASKTQVRAFPFATRRVRPSLGATTLQTLGFAFAVVGGLWAWLPEAVISFEGFLSSLAVAQVTPGQLMLAGVFCFATGFIGRYPRTYAKVMLDQDQTEQAVTELGADLVEMNRTMQELRDDQLQARSDLHQVTAKMRDWFAQDRSGEAKDAMFRLAASLDQLHAAVDRKVGEVGHVLESRMADVFQLVEASRDFLQESIEENSDRAERIERNLAEVFDTVAALEVPAVAEEGEVGELEPPSYDERDPFADPAEEEACEDEEVTFEVEVEFEPADAPTEPMPELGLLDECEDDPSFWTAEEPQAEEPAPAQPAEQVHGLSVLDDPLAAPAEADPQAPAAFQPPAADPAPTFSSTPSFFDAAPTDQEPAAAEEAPAAPAAPQVNSDTGFGQILGDGTPQSPAASEQPPAPLPTPAPEVSFDPPPHWAPTSEVTEVDLDGPSFDDPPAPPARD